MAKSKKKVEVVHLVCEETGDYNYTIKRKQGGEKLKHSTQELWFELVPFDRGLAQRMSDRAVRVIRATEAGEQLPRVATEPGYYECKYCAWAKRCWAVCA